MVRVCLTLLLAALLLQGSAAWQPNARHYLSNSVVLRRPDSLLVVLKNSNTAVDDEQQDSWTEEGWSVADDWNALSSETNAGEDVAINQDIVQTAAQKMLLQDAEEPSQEDMWLNDVIENILQTPLSSTPLYDTGFAASQKTMASPEQQQRAFEENMAKEIAMLVRCNESPEDMLVQAGRALPELTTLQKTDVAQLLTWNDKQDNAWEPTPFLQEAIATMFKRHATAIRNNNNDTTTTTTTMDAKAVSRWMTQSMGSDLDSYTTRGRSRSAKDLVEDMDHSTRTTKKVVKIGPHDSRVLKLLSQYSKYGTGRLRLENLQQVYMDALTRLPNGMPVISDEDHNPLEILQLRNADHIRQVWRDLSNHGIVAPNVQEWKKQRAQLEAQLGKSLLAAKNEQQQGQDFVDECEILDLTYYEPPTTTDTDEHHDEKNHKYIRQSSHEHVDLAPDGKTPLYMTEGEFVFIDEESCIGCMQCVTAAPASFLMLENGRARTFHQRKGPDVKQGVAACPVNCMHHVSYDELKELETVRDKGDGRDDHKHMGHRRGHTPLYVAGIDSDNNHRSSWYHHIKNKCCTSGQCPQRGCFDCPSYRASGENPFFKKKAKKAQHIRAQHFIDRGDVDLWRKTADL